MQTVQYLERERYLGPMTETARKVRRGGNRSALIHDAWVLPHGTDKPRHAVLKFHCHEVESRELLNEIVGHHFAVSLGYLTPEFAGTIELRKSEWPNLPLWKEIAPDTTQATAWWTTAEPEKSVTARFNLDLVNARSPLHLKFKERIKTELRAALEIPAIVAFDGLIANIDRNPGNLLGPRNSRYLLIDHGQCLTGPDWVQSDLRPEVRYVNKLMQIVDWDNQSLAVKNAAVAAIEQIQPKLSACLSELEAWLDGIIAPDEIAAIVAFLIARARRDTAAGRFGLIA